MKRSCKRDRALYRGCHRVLTLCTVLLVVVIIGDGSLIQRARPARLYDLLPSTISEAGLVVAGLCSDFGEHAAQLCRYAAGSSSVLSGVNRELEEPADSKTPPSEDVWETPKEHANSRLHFSKLFAALHRIQQELINAVTSLSEKAVRSAVGIHLPTNTTTLGLTYPATIRTTQSVEQLRSMGTA